jgi:hypothetical protein
VRDPGQSCFSASLPHRRRFTFKKKPRDALRGGRIPSGWRDFCIASMQGGMLMGKIKRSSQTVEITVQEVLAHLKSYFVRG